MTQQKYTVIDFMDDNIDFDLERNLNNLDCLGDVVSVMYMGNHFNGTDRYRVVIAVRCDD